MLRSVNVPALKSIRFHPLTPLSNLYGEQAPSDLAIHKLPIAFNLDDIETKFADVSLCAAPSLFRHCDTTVAVLLRLQCC